MNDLLTKRGIKTLEFLMAMSLAVMAVLVFGNVVLRYGFNSGIAASEDISRFLFVWLSFTGAVVAMKEHTHLGMDSVVKMLPHAGKMVFSVASHLLMLGALGLLFYGSWQQMQLNADSVAMGAVQYPLSWVYAAGVFSSAACLLIVATNFIRILQGKVRDEELVMVQDLEAAIEMELAAHAHDLQEIDDRTTRAHSSTGDQK